MARTIKVGFDDQLTGVIESTPAERLVFKGSEDAQETLRSLVRHHAGNLVASLPPGADDPTADELLDYVVARMRGKRAWAERVDPGFDVPQVNAFCPTGDGGGVDPSCSPDGSGRGIAPTATPLGRTPRLRGFGEAPSEAFTREQARLDAEARAAKTPKGAAKSAQPEVADDVPSALKATSADARRDVERSLRDFRERRGRVTIREARELSDTLAGMTLKDMRSVASSMGVKTPSGRKAEVVRELAERFREKIHEDKGLKEVAAGNWVPRAEADRIIAEVRHEGGAAWQVHDMPGDSASAGRVFVGFEGSASQAEKHGFPLSERVRARLARSSGKGKSTKARTTKNSRAWNAAALGELVRPLPVWLDPLPDGSVSVREATDRGDEVKRVHLGQSFMEWSAPELWQLGRGLVSLVPHSQAAAEAMLDGLDDEDADAVSFALAESDGPAGYGEGANVGPADGDRVDDETLAADFRREVKGRIEAHSDDDHGDDTWRPV